MQCAKNMTLLLIVAWMASLLDSSSSYAIQSPSHHIMHSYPIFGGKNAASGLKARLDRTELKSTSRLPPLLVKKTIWGQNVAKLRSFSINGPKDFKFLGSFASNVPEYALPEVVFLGRSNVGKSSFLNSLTGRSKNVAVVSKTPGRTQRINLFEFSSSKDPICIFADLPGYGFAKVAKERQQEIEIFLRQYLEKRGSIRLAMLMVDSRRIPMLQSDIDMASVSTVLLFQSSILFIYFYSYIFSRFMSYFNLIAIFRLYCVVLARSWPPSCRCDHKNRSCGCEGSRGRYILDLQVIGDDSGADRPLLLSDGRGAAVGMGCRPKRPSQHGRVRPRP